MANFSLKNFRTEINRRGLAKPSRFEAQFNIPAGLGPGFSNITANDVRLVSLFCEVSGLPQQSVGIRNQRIYGPAYPRPFGVEYGGDGLTMTFLIDQSMNVKAFFDAWISKIVDPFQYFVYYLNTYKTDITISQLDEKHNYVYSVILEDAFPRNVALVEVNHGTQNQVHKLNVTFVYRRWKPVHRITSGVSYPETNPRSLQPDSLFTLTTFPNFNQPIPVRNPEPPNSPVPFSSLFKNTNEAAAVAAGQEQALAQAALTNQNTVEGELASLNSAAQLAAARAMAAAGSLNTATIPDTPVGVARNAPQLGYTRGGELALPNESGVAERPVNNGRLALPNETGASERPTTGRLTNNPSPIIEDARILGESPTRQPTTRWTPRLR